MSNSIVRAEEIPQAVWGTLVNSIFPGADENSVMMAVQYCEARGLDVLKKPVHIVPMSVKDSRTGQYVWRDVIMPGIAELRTTASRSTAYGGQTAPEFGEIKTFKIGSKTVEAPESCTVTVFKLINGQQIGFSHTEFFTEACATTKNGDLNSMWSKRPRGQLAKCAEAGALRKAFPEDLGGEISFDEMAEGGSVGTAPNGSEVINGNSISKDTQESIIKGVSAVGKQLADLLSAEQVDTLDQLTEAQGKSIVQSLRADYMASKQSGGPSKEPAPEVPQANEEAVDF